MTVERRQLSAFCIECLCMGILTTEQMFGIIGQEVDLAWLTLLFLSNRQDGSWLVGRVLLPMGAPFGGQRVLPRLLAS